MARMRSSATFSLILFLTCFISGGAEDNCTASTQAATKDVAQTESILLVSTLDGTLHAVSRNSGLVKWKLDDDPVFSVPMDTSMIKGPTFLPDPHDGSLYAFEPISQDLSKLPFTIPELVQASPCRSTDGILYTGRKQDMWIAVNPLTGSREQIITTEDTFAKCPGGESSNMYIGRSEYKITMYDTKKDEIRWNATYKDYSAHVNEKKAVNYDLLHFASSSDGYLVTVDRETGRILWANNYGFPVVGMYTYGPEGGLQKVSMMSMAKETLTFLLQQQNGGISIWENILQWGEKHSGSSQEIALMPSLYVGQFMNSLYALPAMKHDGIGSQSSVLLLPGPINEPSDELEEGSSTAVQVEVSVPSWKLVGYHEIPRRTTTRFPSEEKKEEEPKFPLLTQQPTPDTEAEPSKEAIKSDVHPIHEFQKRFPHVDRLRWLYSRYQKGKLKRHRPPHDRTQEKDKPEPPQTGPRWDEMTIVALLTSVFTGGIVLILSSKGFFSKDSKSNKSTVEGWREVGQIEFDPVDILGRGSEGTVVYRGRFDGRDVAVKRIVPQCFTFADREVALLRESDEHQHVIRYHCMERDSQFRYIALELCSSTLQEYIENPQLQCSVGLELTSVAKQAMMGIQHLHSLGIVHRDVKPSNILISLPNHLGRQRVVISDFGLCKKLVAGRCSFSQRSGMAGTDGWIAPEMILTEKYRMTRAVDIFSIGCVFYYILCGKHPFGDALTRQVRIINGDYSLEELEKLDYYSEAYDLIQCMLHLEPNKRPTAETVLCHPLFWSPEKKLQFFQDVSDRTEKEPYESQVMLRLEGDQKIHVLGDDWRQNLSLPLQMDLKKFRNYRGDSVRDLLRAMRNKKHHYRELTDDVKLSLGTIPDEFLLYFTKRFPNLLVHTYHALSVCRKEKIFQQYYGALAKNHLFSRDLPYLSPEKHPLGKYECAKDEIWGTSDMKKRMDALNHGSSDMDMDWRASARPRQAEEPDFFNSRTSTSNSETSSEASYRSHFLFNDKLGKKGPLKFSPQPYNRSAPDLRNAKKPDSWQSVPRPSSYANAVNQGFSPMGRRILRGDRSPRVSESSTGSCSTLNELDEGQMSLPKNNSTPIVNYDLSPLKVKHKVIEGQVENVRGVQDRKHGPELEADDPQRLTEFDDRKSLEEVLPEESKDEASCPETLSNADVAVSDNKSLDENTEESTNIPPENDQNEAEAVVETPPSGKKPKTKRHRRGKKKKKSEENLQPAPLEDED